MLYYIHMAITNKVMSGMELLKKGAKGLNNVKKKYNAAWEKSQQTPSKQRLKKKMTAGLRP